MSDDHERSGTAARRVVLAGAGMAGVVAALAGCGNDASNQRHPSGDTARGTTARGDTARGSAPPPAAGASGSPAAEEDLGTASGIPVGGGKIFDQQRVVVTQPVAGQFKAFSAVCPHGGCLVSAVSDGVIRCRCHGSLFSASDGSVEAGPSTKPLPARTVALRGDDLILL